MIKRCLLLSLIFFMFPVIVSAQELKPVAVLSIRNLMDVTQKTSLFLSAANPQTGPQAAMLLNMLLLSPQIAAIDIQKPITGYLYFSEPALQPILFASKRQNVNPVNIDFMPGQALEPHTGKNNTVVYYDKAFAGEAVHVKADMIKVPEGDISGVYFFRDVLPIPGQVESSGDLVNLISTELEQFSFALKFHSAKELGVKIDLQSNPDGDLVSFSNSAHPRLRAAVQMLAKPSYLLYAQIPAHPTVGTGFSMLCSMISSDFLDQEHILGKFLNTVISGSHNSAIALSENETFALLSGILPAGETRKKFDQYLKDNGDSYDGKTFVFRQPNGTDLYIRINGDTANLLIRQKDGTQDSVSQAFATLKPARLPLGEREFLRGVIPGDTGWKNFASGTMQNGRFQLNLTITPELKSNLK